MRTFRREGLAGLLYSIRQRYRKARDAYRADEAGIIYEVLSADNYKGIMVDVGAHFGGSLSVYARNGWKVYAFEPDSMNRAKLVERFKNNPNVRVDSRGLSDRPQDNVTLYRSPQSAGISGLSAFHETHAASEQIAVTTLSLFFEEEGIESVDFLKIDTEGFDLFVLKGVPWTKGHPRMILCEFEDAKTVPLGYTFHDMARFLQERGYRLLVSEWHRIDRYGGIHNWRRFAPYPCELKDPRAWGNIMAASDEALYTGLITISELSRKHVTRRNKNPSFA